MNEGNSTEGSDQGHDDDDDGLDDMAGPERMLVSPPKSPLNKKVQDVVGLTLGGTWAMEGRARSLDCLTALALLPDKRQNENANDASTDGEEGQSPEKRRRGSTQAMDAVSPHRSSVADASHRSGDEPKGQAPQNPKNKI